METPDLGPISPTDDACHPTGTTGARCENYRRQFRHAALRRNRPMLIMRFQRACLSCETLARDACTRIVPKRTSSCVLQCNGHIQFVVFGCEPCHQSQGRLRFLLSAEPKVRLRGCILSHFCTKLSWTFFLSNHHSPICEFVGLKAQVPVAGGGNCPRRGRWQLSPSRAVATVPVAGGGNCPRRGRWQLSPSRAVATVPVAGGGNCRSPLSPLGQNSLLNSLCVL